MVKRADKKEICEFPDCNAQAVFLFGLVSSPSELKCLCEGHIESVRQDFVIKLFGWKHRKCIAIKPDGSPCMNSKSFGEYCGIHNKKLPKVKLTKNDEQIIENELMSKREISEMRNLLNNIDLTHNTNNTNTEKEVN